MVRDRDALDYHTEGRPGKLEVVASKSCLTQRDLSLAANVLIFPDLQSANLAYKLPHRPGGAEMVGPVLVGMGKPVHLLQHGCEAKDVVHKAALAVVDAQRHGGAPPPVGGPERAEERELVVAGA